MGSIENEMREINSILFVLTNGLLPRRKKSARTLCIFVGLAALLTGCQVIDQPATSDGDGFARDADMKLDDSWEPAANSVKITNEPISVPLEIVRMDETARSNFAKRAEDDRSWYSGNGERYKAMYIAPSGKAYGRASDATDWPVPDANVGRGSIAYVPDAESAQTDNEANAQRSEPAVLTLEEGVAKARIGTDWTIDRRSRQSSINKLTSAPLRMVGALSGNGNTQRSGCTGTKIGPRAVLTAAHCVMDSSGNISLSGRFNPGQTNTQTPNGSIRWNGVFLRDWRIHRKFDYAVVFLEDSAATVGLGWLGVAYWNNAASYAGRGATLIGYPCGANRSCGAITSQRCKASPRSDKRCDGWMYSHSRDLWTNSFRNDHLLQYDHDMSSGQSGSSVYVKLSSSDRRVVAVNTHSWNGVSMGPRFRASMWNDVCTWIAAKPSAFGSHGSCN